MYKRQIESQQATLKALQSQINPHFIYNTLESISMLALIRDNYELSLIHISKVRRYWKSFRKHQLRAGCGK